MSLSALVTGPGVEEALLCPVLCGESFLPEEEEEAAAPPSSGDTDEEEEVLLLSVLSAPEEDELEEAGGTFAALVFLGFSWLASLSRNFLSASIGGGPRKA
jgi:hypothetical protein